MRTSLTLSASIIALLLVQGCNQQAEPQSEPAPAVEPAIVVVEAPEAEDVKADIQSQKGIVMLEGTVRFFDLEGGFWGILTDDGQQILPSNLAKEYQKDGLRLSFSTTEVTDMMTIQQWGILSTLSNIEVIGQVESKGGNPLI
ncbi:hypothetical protein [Shewanella sp. 10N.286.48.B5]|uniref:hypothetical protein n=1 Tax=Shewanella sp. 10N.286.48.B5 TaxID=1880834 RepID=UPI000C84380D|nr:hypothetical protein [Shewanella sp. 10N.286.48.B5]PMH84260.1 hypothetical protein BCU57_18440 [Shewanella sp. 10N.286.48.B5]